jgi:protoheme IX farnesyltransferase
MLPVVDPSGRRAGALAVANALSLIAVSLIPVLLRLAGPEYFVGAAGCGIVYLLASMSFMVRRDECSARRLLRVSLVYLPAVLGLWLMT